MGLKWPHSVSQKAKEHVQACPCLSFARDHSGPSLLGIPPPVPWGSPKSAPRSPGPYCSPWQAMALSILRVFLLIWTQACGNSMERLQAQGICWRPQHLLKCLEPSNSSATWPMLPPCPSKGQDHYWQARLILKMQSKGH